MASIPSNFNWRAYLYYNPDVKNAGLNTKELAEQHYSQYGQQEGRNYTLPNFNPEQYLQANEDLKNAFGQNTDYATEHYINYVLSGKEQRPLTPTAPAPTTPVTPTPTTPGSNKQSYSLNPEDTTLYTNYVTKYPDLLQGWNDLSTEAQKNYSSIADYGFYHWNYGGGKKETGRDLGGIPSSTAIVTKNLTETINNIYSVYNNAAPTAEELAYWIKEAKTRNLTNQELAEEIKPTKVNFATNEEISTIPGITYDPTKRTWVRGPEKTDYPTDQSKIDLLPTNTAQTYWAGFSIPMQYGYKPTKADYVTFENYSKQDAKNAQANQNYVNYNNSIDSLNTSNAALNKKNTEKNTLYNTLFSTISRTSEGEYVAQRNAIRDIIKNSSTLSDSEKATFQANIEANFKNFYKTEKLKTWNTNLGAEPLYGNFDAKFYKEQNNRAAETAWKQAVADDDLDIVDRYGENGFYLQHYTSIGRKAGIRGNEAEATEAAGNYKELKPTDQDIAAVRDLQLGLPGAEKGTQADRLLGIKEVASAWEAAKNNDPYWSQLAKEKYLNPNDKEQFAVLFRLSNRPEDKQVAFNYNLNTGSGITELEDVINQAGGEKMQIDVKKFSALTQNVLKDTIAEMKKAKVKEQNLSLYKGFSTFGDILSINQQLSDSILGDTGVGGILSFTGGDKAEKSLEKGLEKLTGIQNNTTYNWQKWFDETLKTKYEQDLSLGYKEEDVQKQIDIDKEFAKNYIDGYLKPRFDTSRSMDEFTEYMAVRQEEQNPFQTQDLINAMQLTAQKRADLFLTQVQQAGDRSFDSEFYFNPTGDKAREAVYADQKAAVEKDWEEAKAAIKADKGDSYWEQQAYRFGVDVNDKAQFARMHFQIKGQGKGYDAAEDILNPSKVNDEIYTKILPALKDQAEKSGMTPWVNFIKPEEFADEMLKGIDPVKNKDAWDKLLEKTGLTGFTGTVDEFKKYIIDALRSNTATQIRENIKYLQKKKEDPTQELLGVTYIDRPEDVGTGQATADTELYKIFQQAGFQGTEENFYKEFMPDVNVEDMKLLNIGATNKKLSLSNFNAKDPYEALMSLEDLSEDDSSSTSKTTSEKDTEEDSPFKISIDDTEDTTETDTGQSFLGKYASLFK
jgi:hypothetical protein